ncbi:MAG TPA: TonB-dependent receptor, partial [Ignavibacteriaceae bacterium]|nr:TonB-dependent receptor [Ignavibacteriaceae bacterium]
LHNDFYDPRLETDDRLSNDITSFESSLFLQDNANILSNLSANIGGRLYYFEENNYLSLEPRVSILYSPVNNITLKCGYGLTHQFLHLITRNDISLPTDLWYPSSKKIKPERSNEYVLGIDVNYSYPEYFFSCEAYYRDMKNLLEFSEKADFNINVPIEEILTSGEGESYGLELFFNKRTGNISGWIGYTLSWTKRLFSEINANKIFYPKYDRRHDLSLVLTYNLTALLSLGMTWTYSTGAGITLPLGQYQLYNIGLNNNPSVRVNYSDRNGYKLPDYHKMDLNISYKFSWFNLPFQAYLNFYNLYNRKNSFAQYVAKEEDPENPEKVKLKLKQITLFPFIPTAGVNINF